MNKTLRIQLLVVILGALLLAAKFAAYLITHSNTILTDALESIINVVAGSFALYSLYLSLKPRDADHPYGHGKVEFIAAGFEGILIALAGALIIGKSMFAFFTVSRLENLDIGLWIVFVSGAINYILSYVLIKKGKDVQSLILISDGEHLRSDAVSSFGIIIGILAIKLTGWMQLDNIVAIVFGGYIIYTGIKLVRKSVAGIMDEADEEIIASVVKLLVTHRKSVWIDIHNLRIIQYGNILHIDCHVTLPWYYSLEQAHNEMEEIAAIINERHSAQIEFFIHGDPCVPASCKICSLSNCHERKMPFEQSLEWTLSNITVNKKHSLT